MGEFLKSRSTRTRSAIQVMIKSEERVPGKGWVGWRRRGMGRSAGLGVRGWAERG